MSDTTERAITTCWQNSGYHVYSAGPCFDRLAQAVDYRNRLDFAGKTWVLSGTFLPNPPAGWTSPKDAAVSAVSGVSQ